MKEKSNNDSEEENDINAKKCLSAEFLAVDDNHNYHYPFEKIRTIPIITTTNKELFFLYFSENDYKYFENKGDEFFYSYSNTLKNEVRMGALKNDILFCFLQLFNCINLEERVKISYSEKMQNIKPNYSFAIEMSDDFKNKTFIKSQINDYVFIKKDILKNLDYSKEKIISYDPFYSLKSNSIKNKERKKLYPKFGISLIKKNTQIDDDEDEDLIESRQSFYSNKMKENIKSYKDIIRRIFKITDFRFELIDYCLENDKDFKNDNFEKFICYLEYFINLFTGIQVKYSIDELGLLNMDFYSSEEIFMKMAEILHYQVQFQIIDKSYFQGKRHKKRIPLIKLNNKQYENYDFNKIEYFPPYSTFNSSLWHNYRRYDENDNYHLCKNCMNILFENDLSDVTCSSSCFRFIDKTRLMFMTLLDILNIELIEKMIKLESNYINNIFKSSIFLRNEQVVNNISDNLIILSYLSPIQTEKSKKLDSSFRNIFGESIGYFYTWISHYLTWLLFPTIAGIIALIGEYFLNDNLKEYINYIFLSTIILWGFYYVSDWKKFQIFYNYIWGMNNFVGEKLNSYEQNYNKVSYITFLGIKMEKVNTFQKIANNLISFLALLFSSISIVLINLIIFYIYQMERVRKQFALFTFFSKKLAKFQVPLLILILREIISIFIFKITKFLTNYQKPTDRDKYIDMVTNKRLILEYVNYYYNLYYIAFIRKIKGTCTENDCFSELKNQLMMILIIDSIYIIAKLFYQIFYLRKSQKDFQRLMNKYQSNNNKNLIPNIQHFSIKFKIYTREEFIEEDIQKLIMPVIFHFGYVIQFGVCYPISFLFLLIFTILCRIADSISLIHIFYVKTIEASKGWKYCNKMQNTIIFFGIFTNIGIICYTKGNEFFEFNIIYALVLIISIENGILLIFKAFNFINLPFWFRYRENIQLNYLKKFGVSHRNPKDKFNEIFKNKKI
jgi:hypothetical protein